MHFNLDQYFQELYQSNTPEYSFNCQDKVEWSQWRTELREVIIQDLGGISVKDTALNVELVEEKEYGLYRQQQVIFNVDKYLKTSAYVLIPKNNRNKYPSIVACHGHGYGNKELVGLTPEGEENKGDSGCHNNFALDLVKQGFLVIAPELIGFGDRRLKKDEDKALEESSCYQMATYLLMFNKTLAAMRIMDIRRSIDYLFTRNEVDKERIGCMGFSGGGLPGSFTTAFDDRIKVAVIAGYTNTFKDSIMSIEHCIDNYIPGILRHAELADIIGMIAPRPLLIQSGEEDNIFPIKGTLTAYDQINQIYKLLDSEEKLGKDILPGGHEVSADKPSSWFKKWL